MLQRDYDDFCFPRKNKIEYEGVKSLDGDYECIEYDEYEWGYLKDLYIDFDFFSECIESVRFIYKRCLLQNIKWIIICCKYDMGFSNS